MTESPRLALVQDSDRLKTMIRENLKNEFSLLYKNLIPFYTDQIDCGDEVQLIDSLGRAGGDLLGTERLQAQIAWMRNELAALQAAEAAAQED